MTSNCSTFTWHFYSNVRSEYLFHLWIYRNETQTGDESHLSWGSNINTHICVRRLFICTQKRLTHTQTHTHTHTAMSYSHLRGCWFSEMPQVRCHVHRSPGSKLRPLCLPWHAPSSTLPLSLSISFHTNTPSCDFIYPSFPLKAPSAAALPLLLL